MENASWKEGIEVERTEEEGALHSWPQQKCSGAEHGQAEHSSELLMPMWSE